VAVLLGEDDGQGPGLDEPTGPAVWSRPAGLFPPGDTAPLGLADPGLAEPGLLLEAPGLAEVAALLACAPGVPVVPELGWLGEVSLVEGDGDVEVDGDGLVLDGVGVGVVLVLVGTELFDVPGDGVALDVGETLRWHLVAAVGLGDVPLL
jgi:hypothetical protein